MWFLTVFSEKQTCCDNLVCRGQEGLDGGRCTYGKVPGTRNNEGQFPQLEIQCVYLLKTAAATIQWLRVRAGAWLY